MEFSARRYARMIKRAGRLLTGRDVLYRYDIRPRKASLGSTYGAWTVAPEYVRPNGVMYSFGVGYDISFDEAAITQLKLEAHGFDPSPHIIELMRNRDLPRRFTFHPYGLGEADGVISFFSAVQGGSMRSVRGDEDTIKAELPVKCLQTIVKELDTDCLEILKMDVEGAEYGLLQSLVSCPIPIRQLLIEFHHRSGVGTLQNTIDAVSELRRNGFLLFHVSETSSEFSFLHKSCLA